MNSLAVQVSKTPVKGRMGNPFERIFEACAFPNRLPRTVLLYLLHMDSPYHQLTFGMTLLAKL
jgi:hypothetical protein